MRSGGKKPGDDASWMDQALTLANKAASEGEVPVGAVVVHEGSVVGRGYNRREKDQDPTAHAEIRAITDAARRLGSWRLVDCELFVTLEPCPMCLAACQQARLKRVVYGATDSKGGALSLGYRFHEDARTHHRFWVTHQSNEACGRVLSEFFAQRRREQAATDDS